jgi:hypothetical protein
MVLLSSLIGLVVLEGFVSLVGVVLLVGIVLLVGAVLLVGVTGVSELLDEFFFTIVNMIGTRIIPRTISPRKMMQHIFYVIFSLPCESIYAFLSIFTNLPLPLPHNPLLM